MALFDSEKRPRGLRVPSLSGLKANGFRSNQFVSKKMPEPIQQQEEPPAQAWIPPAHSFAAYPPTTASQPSPAPAAMHTPNKQLPPAPLPSPPPSSKDRVPALQMNTLPARNGQGFSSTPSLNKPVAQRPDPVITQTATPPNEEVPLEDFIPDPESGSDSAPVVNQVPTPEQSDDADSWLPPQPEPVAAPLTKVHFECYQGHRQMPPSNNVWYSVPCMTCQKQDREIRHRCVFCCLRICASCYQGLQQCPNRSLAELMQTDSRI